jgi:hypothetical protein
MLTAMMPGLPIELFGFFYSPLGANFGTGDATLMLHIS